MPVQQSSIVAGSISKSLTFFPHRQVEDGRNRGVASLTIITNGTSGATTTNPASTTCERNCLASGLTVNLTAASGLVTAATPNAAGLNYKEGMLIYPYGAGTSTQPILRVDSVGATGNVLGLSVMAAGTSGATAQTALATVVDGSSGPNGLQVNATASGGVITAVAPISGKEGRGYRIGDIVTVIGTSAAAAVTASVASLTG
jgi:hypothetical protein